jgi:hypothetical protein
VTVEKTFANDVRSLVCNAGGMVSQQHPKFQTCGLLIFEGSPRSARDENPASNTAELTQAGHKRLRISVACETCREKKLKCDALKPACSICIRKKLTCQYATTGRRRRDPTIPIVDGSGSQHGTSPVSGPRSRGLEGVPQDNHSPVSEATSSGRVRRNDGQQSAASTVASRSDVGETPGRLDDAGPFTLAPGPSNSEPQEVQTPAGSDLLPYIDSLLENVHPISCNNFLHPGSICEALDRAPHLLVLAVCGSSAKFMTGESNKRDGQKWANEAKGIVLRSLDRISTLTTSAIQFLVLHEMHEAQYTSAWNLVGMLTIAVSQTFLTA